jgi:hypothetical protein
MVRSIVTLCLIAVGVAGFILGRMEPNLSLPRMAAVTAFAVITGLFVGWCIKKAFFHKNL